MDNVSYELLTLYSHREQLSAQDIAAITNTDALAVYPDIQYLADMEFLRPCIVVRETGIANLPYQITQKGRIALDEEQQKRKYYKFNEIRAWLTLAIAVAGLLISFFALMK